jgi:hypothetical protein
MRNLSEHRHCLALIAQQLQRIVAGAQHISSEFTQVELVCAALLSATAHLLLRAPTVARWFCGHDLPWA